MAIFGSSTPPTVTQEPLRPRPRHSSPLKQKGPNQSVSHQKLSMCDLWSVLTLLFKTVGVAKNKCLLLSIWWSKPSQQAKRRRAKDLPKIYTHTNGKNATHTKMKGVVFLSLQKSLVDLWENKKVVNLLSFVFWWFIALFEVRLIDMGFWKRGNSLRFSFKGSIRGWVIR